MVRGLRWPWVWVLLLACGCEGLQKSPPEASLPQSRAEEKAQENDEPVEPPRNPSPAEPDVDRAPSVEEPPPAPSGPSEIGRFPAGSNQPAQQILLNLRRWVDQRKGRVYATLLDLEQGRVLASHRPREPVNPASNMKILTAAAALDLLGPGYTFRTELRGSIDASGLAKRLFLKGGGDPELSIADLYRLARVARQRGLSQVREIIVDQSLFAGDYVPPAFGQQPTEWAAFRAPVSALALEGNSVSLNVMSTRAGRRAKVWYQPPAVVQSKGTVQTGKRGSGDRVIWDLEPKSDPTRPVSQISGSLAEGLGRRRYSRRLADPRRAGGLALSSILSEMGVGGEKKVSFVEGGEKDRSLLARIEKAERIAYVVSRPMAQVVRALGKRSDNFVAEMLLIALCDEQGDEGRPWSSQQGGRRLVQWLKNGGISTDDLVIKNGSGLFDANRLTSETLALTLARMEGRPEVFPEFLAQLAVYGTGGTLRNRMVGHKERSRVRGKTGTLRNIDALSGYILRRAGRRPLVFSLVVKGASGGHGAVRTQLDRTVFRWLEALAE